MERIGENCAAAQGFGKTTSVTKGGLELPEDEEKKKMEESKAKF